MYTFPSEVMAKRKLPLILCVIFLAAYLITLIFLDAENLKHVRPLLDALTIIHATANRHSALGLSYNTHRNGTFETPEANSSYAEALSTQFTKTET